MGRDVSKSGCDAQTASALKHYAIFVKKKNTDLIIGAFFDIFADYTSYALFVLGFILANPADNGSAGAFLLVTLLISVAALLGLSITSDKSFKELNASKVNICMWGTLQNADSFVALLLMCLFSGLFMQLAIFFGLLLLGKSLLLVSTAYYNLNIAYRPKKKK